MKNILCSSMGHQLTPTKKITRHISEYKCKRCKAEFTLNADGQIVALSQKRKEINITLEKIYLKKTRKHKEPA